MSSVSAERNINWEVNEKEQKIKAEMLCGEKEDSQSLHCIESMFWHVTNTQWLSENVWRPALCQSNRQLSTSSTRSAASSTRTTLLSRERSHNYHLPDHASTLMDNNVFIRMLYKDLGRSQSCWTWFTLNFLSTNSISHVCILCLYVKWFFYALICLQFYICFLTIVFGCGLSAFY